MIHLGRTWIEKFSGSGKWVFLSWRLEWQTFGWNRNEMAMLLRFDECAQSWVAVSSAGNASRAAQNHFQTFSFKVDFGEVFIPPGLDVPRPRVLPEFKRLAHGLRSSNISVLDAKTFYIPNLHYDGAGPDAYFWVGNGSGPNIMGVKVPNELGSYEVLRGYQGEDIEIQLPGNLTVYDIDWLSVWCVEYRHNFGHIFIPKDLDVPPALGQTKITVSSVLFCNGVRS